ncbi:MAG: DciA family protein [Burkholderiales bacterium]
MAKPVTGRSIRTLSNILAGDAQMAAWHERMRRESRLTAAVRRGLPRALADRVRVVQAEPPLLVLGVPSGAVAAALRQRLPEILAGLRREGINFTELRVQVQLGQMAAPTPKVAPGQRVTINAAPLRQLARDLPEGPLKAAVERLARRIG